MEQLWTEIDIQGRYDEPMWVTKVRIEYSSNGIDWTHLHNPIIESKNETHQEKYWFSANSD
jgi:hypothetical protein